MGYTTDFDGQFELDKPLTVSQVETLKAFADERHDGQGFPGIWCQWVANHDGTGICWDGNEKFYNYTEWLAYVIENFLDKWGLTLNGEVTWQGEDAGDIGMLRVVNNDVSEIEGKKVFAPEPPKDIAQLLTDLPRTLVGDGGTPNIHFVTNCDTAQVIAVFVGDEPSLLETATELADKFTEPYMVEDRQNGVVHDNPASERIQREGDED
jgi:hypothetical protein